jgi:hypothetical protein
MPDVRRLSVKSDREWKGESFSDTIHLCSEFAIDNSDLEALKTYVVNHLRV